MKRITDPTFRYTPSHATDVGRHLREFKRKQRDAERAQKQADEEAQAKTVQLPARKHG